MFFHLNSSREIRTRKHPRISTFKNHYNHYHERNYFSLMLNNASKLTLNLLKIENSKYKTARWVKWLNIIFILGLTPVLLLICYQLYQLRIYLPQEWQTSFNQNSGFLILVLYGPILFAFASLHKFLTTDFFGKELFYGPTNYTLANKKNINLKKTLEIKARKIPANTKVIIFAYNKQSTIQLTSRGSSYRAKREQKIKTIEAKAQGVKLNINAYPIKSITKKSQIAIGNVNKIIEFPLPENSKKTSIQQYLPENIPLKALPNPLNQPNLKEDLLTEIVVRVTVYMPGEFQENFEVSLNPPETAFAVEI